MTNLGEDREAQKVGQLMLAFQAHKENGNVGAMASVLSQLKQHSAELACYLGSVESRDSFLKHAEQDVYWERRSRGSDKLGKSITKQQRASSSDGRHYQVSWNRRRGFH
jgi:hypothetical protein